MSVNQPKSASALVLSGGGAKGAFEAGAIASLKSLGPFDIVCGTSAGAINGAFVAQEAFDELTEVWHTIAAERVIQYVDSVKHLVAFFAEIRAASHDPLPREIWDYLKAIGDLIHVGPWAALLDLLGALDPHPIATVLTRHLDFAALKHMLVVTATNITRKSADTFYFEPARTSNFGAKRKAGTARYPLTPANYVQAVQASSSIPGAFPPVNVAANGARYDYVDGGVANNTPIGMAVDAGAGEITVVLVDPLDADPPSSPVGNIVNLGFACLTVMQQKIVADDLKLAQAYNAALTADPTARSPIMSGKRLIDIYVVQPAAPLSLDVLDFDKQELMDAAYAAGVIAGANRQKL